MKAHRGCGSKSPHKHSQGEVGWLVLCSVTFTPRESPRYSFYRRLSGPQDQSGRDGVKKNINPSDTQDRTWAIEPTIIIIITTFCFTVNLHHPFIM